MQRIDIGKLPSRKTRDHFQHRGVGLWKSSGSNRKPLFYGAQKFFGGMAIRSADNQPLISQYENGGLRSISHGLFDFSGERNPRRRVRNPLPVQAAQPLLKLLGSIRLYGPGNGVDRVHVDDHAMPNDR